MCVSLRFLFCRFVGPEVGELAFHRSQCHSGHGEVWLASVPEAKDSARVDTLVLQSCFSYFELILTPLRSSLAEPGIVDSLDCRCIQECGMKVFV